MEETDSNAYLRGLGIEIVSSVDKALGKEYEILYLSGDVAQDFLDDTLKADKKRAALPRRVVISRESPHESGVKDSLHAITTQCLDLSSSDEEGTAQKKILDVYDEWLRFLKNRCLSEKQDRLPLSIFFEDLAETARHWESACGLSVPDFVNFHACGGEAENIERWAERQDSGGIHLWRHTPAAKALGETPPDSSPFPKPPVYYRKQSYGNPLFAYIASVNPESEPFQCSYLMRQIVEMALTRVVVIDERVAQSVAAETEQYVSEDSESIGGTLAHQLAWAGVWVVGRVELGIKSDGNREILRFEDDEGEKEAVFTIGTQPSARNGLMTMQIDLNHEKGEFDITVNPPTDFDDFPNPPDRIEALSLHQSIFDTDLRYPLKVLFDNYVKIFQGGVGENLVWRLKPTVMSTYFHSGRGHPQGRLPENAPYLDYSSLQVHLLNQPSKFFFVQQAFASTNSYTKDNK